MKNTYCFGKGLKQLAKNMENILSSLVDMVRQKENS